MGKRLIRSEQSYNPLQDEYSEQKALKRCAFRNGKRSQWNAEQNIKYAAFLRENEWMFRDTKTRKRCKVFTLISKHMGSRTTGQAKSHHQKMLKRHQEVRKIIQYFELNFQRKEEKNSTWVSVSNGEYEMQIKLEKQVLTQRYDQSMEGLLERISLFRQWEDFEQSNLCDWLQEI